MEVLYLASSVLSLFFVLILSGKKNKSRSDKILFVWFVLLFSNVLTFYLISRNLAPFWLVEFLDNSVFLHGPLLWLYTSSLTGNLEKWSSSVLPHFVPFTVFFLVSAWLNYIDWRYLNLFTNSLIILKFISPLYYIILSLRLIFRYRDKIVNIYSEVNHLELRWLSSVLYGGLVLIALGSVTLLIHHFTSVKIPQFGGEYLNIAYSISIIILGYFGFKQTTIFIPPYLRGNVTNPSMQAEKKLGILSKSFGLKDSVEEKLYQELLLFMEREKPFVDKNLTLYKLAGQLNVSENKLSQIMNSIGEMNFFDFINEYRVKTVISMMERGEHRSNTLLGLALDSGFNSKATFNRSFKKFTGLTPSEYLKKVRYNRF